MSKENKKDKMNVVIVGHVDHGKSTIIGRLLADTGSLPDGKLEQVKEMCRRNSKPFEYAFLIDALKEEQSQGITIDSARVFFQTPKRYYIIIDAPGHIEFLKNMITGASRAEAALLVIDASEGVKENSRRHGYMLAMLGIKKVVVLINKMDLVGYDKSVFENIKNEYSKFLSDINLNCNLFIPVSGIEGTNITCLNQKTEWYKGDTVLDVLDKFEKEPYPVDKPFRMFVQGVYKFTNFGDTRRIIAGTIETGGIKIGDEIVFYPSGKKSVINSIEVFNDKPKNKELAGNPVGFTLKEQIYVTRGELASKLGQSKPKVSTRLFVSLFWLSKNPMILKKEYVFKIGTAKVPMKIEKINRVIDASNLKTDENKNQIERHDICECILKINKDVAVDCADEINKTGRFVIVDDYEISGGGIIREVLPDSQTWVRDKVLLREYKWEKSLISANLRAEKYSQNSCLVLITGKKSEIKKDIAKKLEYILFNDGKLVYYLGIGSVIYGVDADLKRQSGEHNRREHIRRLAEVANILLDAGFILVVTATELYQSDLEVIKTIIDPMKIETVWVDEIKTDLIFDTHLDSEIGSEENSRILKTKLQEKGFIFKPW